MKHIGESTIWVEKYRPKTISDVILREKLQSFFQKIVTDGEIPNMLFMGSAGLGKTSISKALANDLGCDVLYVNASVETSIDTIRYKVNQFAQTHSLVSDRKKLIILDECERVSSAGQDALKVILEECESNARFIFCTNNPQRIIDPLKSRLMPIAFNQSEKEAQKIMLAAFKRVIFILESEKVVYDKEVVAQFVKKLYPDLRRVVNHLQMFSNMNGNTIDSKLTHFADASASFSEIIAAAKAKKFNELRKLACVVEPGEFYTWFYQHAIDDLVDACKPEVILVLAQYAFQHNQTTDPEINLTAALVEITSKAKWR